ncbi:hypothetical protein BaRGS_00012995 [Batillaria attramentaria]|uniref:Ribosome-recycling factor, mitochondrial n=1 Tax=Batillaria attramentaria TaxID=370345 RepID=A0ABD0L9A9_9CAEN
MAARSLFSTTFPRALTACASSTSTAHAAAAVRGSVRRHLLTDRILTSNTLTARCLWNTRHYVTPSPCTHSHHLLLSRGLQSVSWCVVRGYAKKAKKEKVVKGGKKKVVLTAEELNGVLELQRLQEEMQAAVEEFRQQLIQQVSIRTNIGVYDNLQVKTDDGVFPLIQLGQIVQKNPTLILVNMAAAPQYIVAVKDAIGQSGLNVNPQQDGTTIFIPVPK